jgi:hypothetical protein
MSEWPNQETTQKVSNYRMRLFEIIARLKEQGNRTSLDNKDAMNQLKREYRKLTHEGSGLVTTLALRDLFSSFSGAASVLVGFVPMHDSDKKLLEIAIKEIAPKGIDFYSSRDRAHQYEVQNGSSLALQEYTQKAQQAQSQSDQALDQTLQNLGEDIKSVSRG